MWSPSRELPKQLIARFLDFPIALLALGNAGRT